MHFVHSRKAKTKRNAHLAMTTWYLEDSQRYVTINYASFTLLAKKLPLKEREKRKYQLWSHRKNSLLVPEAFLIESNIRRKVVRHLE
jgi:hypothetical protein